MWKKEYAKRRRERYAADAAERERRRKQCRSHEDNVEYMAKYYKENREAVLEKQKEIRKRDPEKTKAKRRAEYAANPEKAKESAKKWARDNPERVKRRRLRKYGITLEEYHQMLESQEGKCAICGHSDQSKPLFFPVVDHCHNHSHVRGLLCMNCNQGLGKFKDNIDRLKAAIKYLENSTKGVE